MPTYRYKCTSCEKEQEIVQKITEEKLIICPFCKAETFTRIPASDVAIQFKGSGFYKTDYTPYKKDSDNT